jgi:CubicO group peptidase (beta-lactamase class C family)
MIAERAAGRSYRDLVHEMVIDATGPTSTFYENGTYPAAVAGQIGKPVDLAKQVIVGDMPLNAEAVEQRLLHHPPLAHEMLLFPSEELSTFPRASPKLLASKHVGSLSTHTEVPGYGSSGACDSKAEVHDLSRIGWDGCWTTREP